MGAFVRIIAVMLAVVVLLMIIVIIMLIMTIVMISCSHSALCLLRFLSLEPKRSSKNPILNSVIVVWQ